MMTRLKSNGLPPAQGLYDPAHEHDACGIGFVASISGNKSHDIIRKGIQVLLNLAHRGACGCDPETGDGAGVLIQIPHKFFVRECEKLGFTLPAGGEFGLMFVYMAVIYVVIRDFGATAQGRGCGRWRSPPCATCVTVAIK